MQLYDYRDPRGNFGDDLNLWLWPRLLPGLLDSNPDDLLLGIGTIINTRAPAASHLGRHGRRSRPVCQDLGDREAALG